MLRFVILVHDHPFLHWDFLLENGDSCRTWRLLTDPASPSNEISAEAIANHRLMYLDFEGPVSANRGTVVRWDTGTFEWHINTDSICEVALSGNRWQGTVRIEKTNGNLWQGQRQA